jgi:hypothetical protein
LSGSIAIGNDFCKGAPRADRCDARTPSNQAEEYVMSRMHAPSAALVALLVCGTSGFAHEAAERLYHARHWLEKADRDYSGHRASAVTEVKAALKALGDNPDAHPTKIPEKPVHEKQWKSDDQLRHSRKLLLEVKDHLHEKHPGKHKDALEHIAKAVHEIDIALKVK